jgi:hypothetical protein
MLAVFIAERQVVKQVFGEQNALAGEDGGDARTHSADVGDFGIEAWGRAGHNLDAK